MASALSQPTALRPRHRLPPIWNALPWLSLLGLAAALRLPHLANVAADPYYDGAVRAMGTSLHNFLFGALEPGGTTSLDKPPLDLWPAVVFTKVLGFSPFAERLPEALAGSFSPPLLYAALRRPLGRAVAWLAGLALALLPVAVITARSDTTDALMTLCSCGALYCTVRAGEGEGRRFWVGGALLLGLAFEVKLGESLLALPPLALLAVAFLRKRRGGLRFGAALALLYLLSASLWLLLTAPIPSADQPFALGSEHGKPWEAALIFNGIDRLKGVEAIEGASPYYNPHHHYPERTQAQRYRIPITAPSPTRLLARVGPLSATRLGYELLAGLLFGLPAVLCTLRKGKGGPPARGPLLGALLLWWVEGVVFFSALARLHPRYTEAFTPAAAALVGVGTVLVVPTPASLLYTAAALALSLVYLQYLLFGLTTLFWLSLVLAAVALLLQGASLRRRRFPLLAGARLALAASFLVVALVASVEGQVDNTSFGNVLGALPAAELRALSHFLPAHQGKARYEVAYASATEMGAVVEATDRPVLPLTTYNGHPFLSPVRLAALVARGVVRYAVLTGSCSRPDPHNPNCAPPARWVRQVGRDRSKELGLPPGTLYELPVPKPANAHATLKGSNGAGRRAPNPGG